MSKTTLNPVFQAVEALTTYVAALPDPSTHTWPKQIVLWAISLPSIDAAVRRYTDLPQMVAAILLSLPVEKREMILRDYALSQSLRDAIDAMGYTPFFPDMIPQKDFEDVTSDDLMAYKERIKAALNTEMNERASKIIQSSPRAMLQQGWLGLCAVTALLNDASPIQTTSTDTITDMIGPNSSLGVFKDKIGADTTVEAAEAYLTRGSAWDDANSTLLRIASEARVNIDGSDSVAVAKAYYDTALEDCDAVISTLIQTT